VRDVRGHEHRLAPLGRDGLAPDDELGRAVEDGDERVEGGGAGSVASIAQAAFAPAAGSI
jgi:hypothetical protein